MVKTQEVEVEGSEGQGQGQSQLPETLSQTPDKQNTSRERERRVPYFPLIGPPVT